MTVRIWMSNDRHPEAVATTDGVIDANVVVAGTAAGRAAGTQARGGWSLRVAKPTRALRQALERSVLNLVAGTPQVALDCLWRRLRRRIDRPASRRAVTLVSLRRFQSARRPGFPRSACEPLPGHPRNSRPPFCQPIRQIIIHRIIHGISQSHAQPITMSIRCVFSMTRSRSGTTPPIRSRDGQCRADSCRPDGPWRASIASVPRLRPRT